MGIIEYSQVFTFFSKSIALFVILFFSSLTWVMRRKIHILYHPLILRHCFNHPKEGYCRCDPLNGYRA
ncbi:hypothetical protein CPB83DRAFT_850755 [Crepidotus variabilis]|uniref:Uncharacterized protein n=1 Tax=Crepidotus variabilis TaxID=179855 RepID=A0A9P6EIK8_9AGAR|nr:hypothetical protein CPB83DRAFT_850755 [Crepidotus variabilis]